MILALPAVVGGQYRDHPDNHQTTGAHMTRYTAFVIDTTTNTATTWIGSVDAATEEEATALAEAKCAEDWEYSTDDVLCIGLAKGDVDIAYWHPDY